ncbi:MAG: VWA domain-containing protein [Acidobacteriota bacterium]
MSPNAPKSPRRRGRRLPRALPSLAALALAVATTATPGVRAGTRSTDEPIRGLQFAQIERVQLVIVPATVTDRKGRPVLGLTQDDFTLFDENNPREIEFFATETNAPISLAFLLDVSGSMRQPGKLESAKSAIASFLDDPGREDLFGLIGFADAQVTWITSFTTDSREFLERLNVQEAYGQTALYDALAASPRLVDEDPHKRKAIVLFTDGLDNASRFTPSEAVRLARLVSVPIYTISFIPLPRKMLSEENRESLLILQRFSNETGGSLFAIHDSQDLAAAIDRIQQDLRSQYVFGFSPDLTETDTGFRRIRLETRSSRLSVHTRTGYNSGS